MREVEIFVSRDQGRRWQFVARQPVESGSFAFRADADGEYWFASRGVPATGGSPQFNGHPQLRVLVNTKEPMPMTDQSSPPSETRPVTPPRPERVPVGSRAESRETTTSPPQAGAGEVNSPPVAPSVEGERGGRSEQQRDGVVTHASAISTERAITEAPQRAFGPRLPGFDPSTAVGDQGNLLDDLLSGMSPFMDVQPVVRRAIPNNPILSNAAPATQSPPVSPPVSPSVSPSIDVTAGSIARIDLNTGTERPRIIVRWHTGHEPWRDAQIDVMRSSSKEGPWIPIAINLPNNGEYWWFLTPEDMRPFYVAVRVRSLTGAVQVDISQSAITIDPRLAQFQVVL